jgi:hypothetical protein
MLLSAQLVVEVVRDERLSAAVAQRGLCATALFDSIVMCFIDITIELWYTAQQRTADGAGMESTRREKEGVTSEAVVS